MVKIVPKRKVIVESTPPEVLDKLQSAVDGVKPMELFDWPYPEMLPTPVGGELVNSKSKTFSFTDMLSVGGAIVAVNFIFNVKKKEFDLQWVSGKKVIGRPMTIAEKGAGLAHARRRLAEIPSPDLESLVREAEKITDADLRARISRAKA